MQFTLPARVLCITMFWLAAAAGNADVRYGTDNALVVGVSAYEDQSLSRLKTTINDASVLHDVLQRDYGFHSTLLLNPTRYELMTALEEMRVGLTEDDNLLIYFAGHGEIDRISGDGFWLPVDAEADNRANWVAIDTITATLKSMAAHHVLVISDSCYSGILTRNVPPTPARAAEIERLAEKRSRRAMTSGGVEPVDDGGGDGHSVFARALLETLRANNEVIDGAGLFTRVRQRVVAGSEQTPEYSIIRNSGDEGGDFLLVPKEPRASGARAPTDVPSPITAARDFDFDGLWISDVIQNPYSRRDRYRIEFELRSLGNKVLGSVLYRATDESGRGYAYKKGIVDGERSDNLVTFATNDEVWQGSELISYRKVFYLVPDQQGVEVTIQDTRGEPPMVFRVARPE